jgi:hypothetical protein
VTTANGWLSSRYFTLLVLVAGIAVLFQGLRWYGQYLDRVGTPAAGAASAPPRTSPPAPSTPPAEMPPSPEDLQALESGEPAAQIAAVDTLLKRRMTPELAAAVARAVPADAAAGKKLECLEARVPGPESLEWTLARVADPEVADDTEHCRCLLQALSQRVAEGPQRVVEALFPFAVSWRARVREPAVAGLEAARLDALPPSVLERIRTRTTSTTVRAAFALGIEDHAPELVQTWLFHHGRSIQHVARRSLAGSSSPAAAPLLIRALLSHRDDPELLSLARDREDSHGDACAQLARVALDPAEPLDARRTALELFTAIGDSEDVPVLLPLREGSEPVLASYANAAAAELARRLPRPRKR